MSSLLSMEDLHRQQVGFDVVLPPPKNEVQLVAVGHAAGGGGCGSCGGGPSPEELERLNVPSCFEEACARGQLEFVVLQWAQGIDPSTRRAVYSGSDATPLMWAALQGHLPVVRFLVDKGADVNAVSSLGHTALHWAATNGHYDVARFLLDHGADPMRADHQGYDACMTAVQHGSLPMLMLLLEGRVLDPLKRDAEGHSLLTWAAYRNMPGTCELLIDVWKFDVNVMDAFGRTPLAWAAREGHAEVVELLLSRGADRERRDREEMSPMQYAITRRHFETQVVLREFGRASYRGVRQRRLAGTLRLCSQQWAGLLLAVGGAVYVLLALAVTALLPPILSYFPFGFYYFKNVGVTMVAGLPTRGGDARPRTLSEEIGMPSNFAQAVRGTWLTRHRDPSCLFAIATMLLVQAVAWKEMLAVARAMGGLNWRGSTAGYSNGMLVLLGLVGVTAVGCKVLAGRAVVKPAEETSLTDSPIAAAVATREYRRFHPRVLIPERHTRIPLRGFYCFEWDVIVRRFDSYSAALDCPIGQSNHLFFLLFATLLAVYEAVLFITGVREMWKMLGCPAEQSLPLVVFNLLVHALPCKDEIGVNRSLLWVLQLVVPTQANFLGVWALQFSFAVAVMALYVAVRQWSAALHGVTRMEINNPTAPMLDGTLLPITNGRRYHFSNHGNGSWGLAMMLRFFFGASRWKDAVAVTSTFAPVMSYTTPTAVAGGER